MGLLDVLGGLLKDPYQANGGWAYSLLSPTASTNTPVPGNPGAPSPFSMPPSLLGDSLLGRLIRGGLNGAAGSVGYTGLAAAGAGAAAASHAATQRQLLRGQTALGGQQFAEGNLNLAQSRLGLQKTFEQYKYFKLIPESMTFEDWVAQQGNLGTPSTPPSIAGAPQTGSGGFAPMPTGSDGVARPYANPPQLDQTVNPTAPPSSGPSAGAPQVGQATQDNSTPIDPALANVTDPSNPQVIYALQKLAFTMGQPAADMVQKAMIAGMPYQKALSIVTAQAAAGNANITDRGAGTSNIALRTDAQGNPLPPALISRNPVQVPGYDSKTGEPTTNFAFPPMQGEIANAPGAAGSGPTSFVTGPPPGQTDVWKAAADRDTQLRDLGAGVNTRINLLQNLSQLAGDTRFGTGRETQYTWEKLAQIIPGVTIGQTDAENMDIFKKFVSNLGVQYQQASGGKGTDAQLQNALEGLPSVDKLSGAIQKIVPYMVAQESAIKGQLNARTQWKQKNGDSPASLLKFEDTWRNNFDPEVYQFEQMNPDQQAAFKANLAKSPKKFQDFRNHLMALTQLGAVQ